MPLNREQWWAAIARCQPFTLMILFYYEATSGACFGSQSDSAALAVGKRAVCPVEFRQ